MKSKRPSTVIVLGFVISFILIGVSGAQFREISRTGSPCSENIVVNEVEFFQHDASSENVHIPGLDGEAKVIHHSHKSPFLAAGLSIILPGLGEYYVGDQIWRGVIFTVLDGLFWYERYHYFARGDDSTNAFHAFADTLWSSEKYGDSLNSLLAYSHRSFRITNFNDFSQINKAEDTLAAIFENDITKPFTHRLPEKGSQQYYELISKYIQFTYGWKDAIDSDPTHSAEYQRHAFMRENMNHQYEIADYFLYGLVLNRILSAIDAVLLARDHNSAIHLEGELQQHRYLDGTLGFIPTAHIRYTF